MIKSLVDIIKGKVVPCKIVLLGITAGAILVTFSLTDLDNDGLKTIDELKYGTNPIVRDADTELWAYKTKEWSFEYGDSIAPLDPSNSSEYGELTASINPSRYITPDNPIVQWYAERVELKPTVFGVYEDDLLEDKDPFSQEILEIIRSTTKSGSADLILRFQNSNFHRRFVSPKDRFGVVNYCTNPAYYLTHKREGHCADWSVAAASILEAKGHSSVVVFGVDLNSEEKVGSFRVGDFFVETAIDSNVYAGHFDDFMPRDRFYELCPQKPVLMFGKNFDFIPYDKNWFKLDFFTK